MKPITERIESISISIGKNDYFNNTDRISIWGSEGNKIYPIAYIHKPKGISLEDWQVIKSKLEIKLLK